MKYKKPWKVLIPDYRWQAIGDWLIARHLEFFGSDELISQYISSWYKQFDKIKYIEQIMGWDKWVISVWDYQEFLDNLRKILPKKYRLHGTIGKPWFDNVMPMVALWMSPLTFEAAAMKITNAPNNLLAKPFNE